MERNDYTEVTKIIRIIDEMLKHMSVVLEEVPSIVLLAFDILPSKIRDLKASYKAMTDEEIGKTFGSSAPCIKSGLFGQSNKLLSDILRTLRH